MATAHEPTFADLLRRFRRAVGLSQEALAERAGLSRRGVSELETGVSQAPRKDTVTLLADALELDGDERALFLSRAQWSRRLSGPSVPKTRRPGATTALVGREKELALLDRFLAGTEPPVLLLAGEPGIGKSRLLQEAAARAVNGGWTVLAGGCTRRSGQQPYAPFPDALASWLRVRSRSRLKADLDGCGWLVRLLPELLGEQLMPAPTWTLPTDQERRLMFTAVGRFLANIADSAGTLLLLDDLQWAGEDALDLLTALVREHTERPLLLLGAYRDTEVRPEDALGMLLPDLARERLARQVPVGPLNPAEARSLLAELLADAADDAGAQAAVAERVIQRTGGVPYFLVSCAQELQAGADGTESVPWNIGQSIQVRTAALGPAAQKVLRAAAVIGRLVPHSLLAAIMAQEGLAERDLLGALEAAERARLLVPAEGTVPVPSYQYAHDLVREAILADLPPALRLALHRATATALEELPEAERRSRVAELADHLLQAGEGARALPYLLRAGDQAEALYAPAEAERYYRTAARVAGELGDLPRAAEALEKLGGILVFNTHLEDALRVYSEAAQAYAAVGDILGQRRVTARSAETVGNTGDHERGRALLQPLLETSIAGEPASTVADMYCTLAWLCTDPLERLAACERAAEIAREIGDMRILTWAEFTRGNTLLGNLGRIEEARQSLESIVALIETSGNQRLLCSTLNLLADASVRSGRFGAAQAYADRALALTDRVGPSQLAWTCCNHGFVAYYAGDWQRAYIDFERGDAIYRGPGSMLEDGFARWGMGQVLLARGEIDEGTRLLEEAIAVAEAHKDMEAETLQGAHAALAERDLVAGDPASARARLQPLLERLRSKPGLVTRILSLLAWAYLGLGDVDHAASLTRDALASARAGSEQLELVEALRIAGMVAARRSRWSDAQVALEEALALSRAMPYPYAQARILYTSGLMPLQRQQFELAYQRLRAAQDICARLGEGLYSKPIAQQLVESGRP
jgi:tetratricopeptide (TPR) repeat protein/transcriptional regulator with XRE-family HTH domain